MPKGNHYGRTQTRAYTTEYHFISAKPFKNLLTLPLGTYSLVTDYISNDHKKFNLTELDCGVRLMSFIINGIPHKITLALDNRSASNKLYIGCPYCQKPRQKLYAIKYAFGCRQCIGLHYECQSERPNERLVRRIRKLRKELWGHDWPEIDNMFEQVAYWPKPKLMRWKTFQQKLSEITELENQYWPVIAEQLKKLEFNNSFPFYNA